MKKACLVLSWVAIAVSLHAAPLAPQTTDCVIIAPVNGSFQEQLAAKEVRRYIYLRTGQLLGIVNAEKIPLGTKRAIVVGTKQRALLQQLAPTLAARLSGLKPESYLLQTITTRGKTIVVIAGGDGSGALYGAYRFAEHLGMAFSLDGDVIPDGRIPFVLPVVNEKAAPLFKLRGIQPFHDFPEGPDWWNTDDYLAIIGQLPKMRMNFIGLHTYPEGAPNAEPTVWIGREGEWNQDGTVRYAYPASYQNTLRGNWGYRSKKTSDYSHGASMLFDRDDYGSEIMRGRTPEPNTDSLSIEVFNHTGAMLRKAFTAAQQLGVKTCVGTETFLTIPRQVKDRLSKEGKDPDDSATVRQLYKGMFRRIMDTYPIDYYWLWTPEGWTWDDAGGGAIRKTMTDLSIAIQAASEIRAPFQLATCGWVLGPPSDRGLFDRELPKNISVSCINREVGKAPVEMAFAHVKGRSCWAIPWMEDDPSLLAPELWAGRTRKDAADALAYGCDGLLGIHWRTRILSPNFMALARAAWDQQPWSKGNVPLPDRRGPLGGTYVAAPDSVRIKKTNDEGIYRTIRDKVFGYHLEVPNGSYRVTLQFCEPVPTGRRVFDVLLQGKKVIDTLDIAARADTACALDYSFDAIPVTKRLLNIDFVDRIGYPCIAGIVIEGKSFSRRINCGGPAYKKYEADDPATPRALPVDDLYREWSLHQFGPEVADAAARIFASQDSRLPEPATWITGPGNVLPNDSTWEQVRYKYRFVDSLQQLRSSVRGKGNLERFDFWLNTFLHMKGIAQLGCLWGAYGRAYNRVFHFKPIPSTMLLPLSGTGHGLRGQYFNDTTMSGVPAVTRVDSTVNFRWSGKPPCEGVRGSCFSVRWQGTMLADSSGPGRIGVTNDDGARLWVDGKLLVDDWSAHATKTTLADFTYEAGRKYDIRIEYFQNVGGAEIQLVGGLVNSDSVHQLIYSTLLPLRKHMIETIQRLYGHLLATVTNSSELGTIANWEQHNIPILLDEPGAELEKQMGRPLSEDLKQLPRLYDGSSRVILPTVRTMAVENEMLYLKVLVLSSAAPEEIAVKWRTMGAGAYQTLELKHVSRGVYETSIPVKDSDIEYYVEVRAGDQKLFFPALAPEVPQTVLVVPAASSFTKVSAIH